MFRKVIRILINLKAAFIAFKYSFLHGGYVTAKIAYNTPGETLAGKKILITGGGTGIGFSIAKKCIDEGATVLITGRTESKLKEAKIKIGSDHLKTLVWDQSIVSQCQHNIEKSTRLLGGEIDVLVNNAAIMDGVGFPDVKEEVWDDIYKTNSKGLFFLTQQIVRHWTGRKRDGYKKIVNISSQGGFVGSVNPYRMTKWDIAGFTQGIGLSMAKEGIIVNGIAPGIIVTDMQKKYIGQGSNIFCHQNPLQRYAYPEEIAELASFLISDSGNFIVGQTIVSDGGYSLK